MAKTICLPTHSGKHDYNCMVWSVLVTINTLVVLTVLNFKFFMARDKKTQKVLTFESPHDKTNKMCRPSLVRVFAVPMKKAWVLSYPLSAQLRIWSEWLDSKLIWVLACQTSILLVLSWGGSYFTYYAIKGVMQHEHVMGTHCNHRAEVIINEYIAYFKELKKKK